MRKIIYTVNADGKVSPVTRQWGGTQGEHNATEIIFDFSALYDNLATENWRIDFDSAEAGFDPGGTIRPLLLENVISRAIPQKYTKNGGEMTAILVGTERAPDGSETVRIVCSIPVTIYFTEAERHEETEGQVVESLSEMERKVLQAAEEATEHIDAAEQRTLEKVADIQQKLDNGEFIGEQGPKGDKGDTGSIGPRGPQGVKGDKGDKGDSYNLTEADKVDIAKLTNVDSKQDKFASVTERDGAVILTSTVSDDRPPRVVFRNGVLELGAMHLQFGDGMGEVSLEGSAVPDDSLNINANDNRIRNVADPIFDKDAVNKKYLERNLPSIDQTYTPESTNAQSGIAVAEAFNNRELKLIKSITLEEDVTDINVTFDKELKEFFVLIAGTTDGENAQLAVRTDNGAHYFVWGNVSSYQLRDAYRCFYAHSKEVFERVWETIYPYMSPPYLSGTSDGNRDAVITVSDRDETLSRYITNLNIFTIGRTVKIATGATVKIWGVEADENI